MPLSGGVGIWNNAIAGPALYWLGLLLWTGQIKPGKQSLLTTTGWMQLCNVSSSVLSSYRAVFVFNIPRLKCGCVGTRTTLIAYLMHWEDSTADMIIKLTQYAGKLLYDSTFHCLQCFAVSCAFWFQNYDSKIEFNDEGRHRRMIC